MPEIPSNLPAPPAAPSGQQFTGTLDRGHVRVVGPLAGRLQIGDEAIRLGGPLSGFSAERHTIDAIEVDRRGRRIRVALRSGTTSAWFGGSAVPAALDAAGRLGWPVRERA